MKRYALAAVIPPVSVCRYGCSGCCAAPIGVFWLASITSMIYGYFGGPLGLDGISWGTLGLGALLYVISVIWAWTTIRAVDLDKCADKSSSWCSRIFTNEPDESDPMDEVRKAKS